MVNSEEIYKASIGGAIIALATSLNLVLKGRISGISGIVFGMVTRNNFLWRFSFVLGLLYASSYTYNFIDKNLFDSTEAFLGDLSPIGFMIGGFLVGLGTKMGNGCTSGHGVCGVSRLSIRSIVACIMFCLTGVITATLRHQVPFLNQPDLISMSKNINTKEFHYTLFAALNLFALFIPVLILYKRLYEQIYDYFISITSGIIFGIGLIISGMVKKTKVINFLDVTSSNWDPSLLFVLISAVGVNLVLFNLIIKVKKTPIFAEKIDLPTKTKVDLPLVLGAAIFGIGWGLSGMCPGPAIVNMFNYIPHTIAYMVLLVLGQLSSVYLEKLL